MARSTHSALASVYALGAFGASIASGAVLGAGLSAIVAPAGVDFVSALAHRLGEYAPHFLGHITASSLAKKLGRRWGDRWRDRSRVLANHDLLSLVGESIVAGLRELADDDSKIREPAQAHLLERMAEETPKIWARIAQHPGIARLEAKSLDESVEAHVASALEGPAAIASARPLTKEQWLAVLRRIAVNARIATDDDGSGLAPGAKVLHANTLDTAAAHLERRTAAIFFELLKEDFARPEGGRAYAAAQLMAFADVRAALKDAAGAAPAPTIDALGSRLDAAFDGLVANLDDRARRRHRVLFDGLSRVDRRIERVLRLVEPTLRLDPRPVDEERGANLARRLAARNRAVPFVGRANEIDALTEWLADRRPVSVRLVVGGAGMGKTRLGLELCDRARAVGWDAGFASDAALEELLRDKALSWDWSEPTLVVVDYAGGRVHQLKPWLEGLSDRRAELGDRPPLRILLLDRHVDLDGQGSLGRLLSPSASNFGMAMSEWRTPDDDLDLAAIADDAEAHEILHEASEAYGAEGAASEESTRELLESLPRLRLDRTPLLLQIAVLFRTAILGGEIPSLEVLLEWWWQRELEIQERIAAERRVGAGVLEALVIVACLRQDLGSRADDVAREVDDLAGRFGKEGGSSESIAAAARAYLGSEADHLLPIVPDLLAEYAVLRFLDGKSSESHRWRNVDERAAWVLRHVAASPALAPAFLVRAAEDFPEWTSAWGFLDAASCVEPWSREAIESACDAISGASPALAPLTVTLTTTLLPRLELSIENEPERAALLTQLAMQFSLLGRPRDSLSAFSESVAILRRCAEREPDEYSLALALILQFWVSQLGAVGRHQEGIEAAKEAAAVLGRLEERHSDLPEVQLVLANHMASLASLHSSMGLREEALAEIQNAVRVSRSLAAEILHDAQLATFLKLEAETLEALGRSAQAERVWTEAVGRFRRLSRETPDVFDLLLGGSLNNHALSLLSLDRPQEALTASREAVSIFRKLERVRAASIGDRELGMSLGTLALALRRNGRADEALRTAEESVEALRRVPQEGNLSFERDLADGLRTLRKCVLDRGRVDLALEIDGEVVGLARRLAKLVPARFDELLAASLQGLSEDLTALARLDEALAAICEAIAVYRRVQATGVEGSDFGLACFLLDLGDRSARCHRPAREIEEALGEAFAILRRLASKEPARYEVALARGLVNAAPSLTAAGLRERSLEAQREGVDVFRRLARANPAFEAEAANAQKNLDLDLAAAPPPEPHLDRP